MTDADKDKATALKLAELDRSHKRMAQISTDFPLPSEQTVVRIAVTRGKNLTPLENDRLFELMFEYLSGIGFDSISAEGNCYKRSEAAVNRDMETLAIFTKRKGRWVRF